MLGAKGSKIRELCCVAVAVAAYLSSGGGISVDLQRNEKGESALHRACIEGNLRKVKLLIDTVMFILILCVIHSI